MITEIAACVDCACFRRRALLCVSPYWKHHRFRCPRKWQDDQTVA